MRGAPMSWALAAVVVAACGGETATREVVETPPTRPVTTPVTTPVPTTPATAVVTTALVEDQPPPTTSVPVPTLPGIDAASTTTTTTTTTTTPATTPAPLSGSVVLRGDGLGEARFGRPMAEVEQWLVDELGSPMWESVARAPLAASQWYEARDLFRMLTFEIGELSPETGTVTSLVVRFSDVSDARDDGVVHLAGWETWLDGTELLDFPADLRIGMSVAELEERFPNLVFTPAPGFEIVTGDSGEAGLRGNLSAGVVVGLEAGNRLREHDEIPAAPPTPGGPIIADPVLRPDGLAGVDFGGPAEDLVATLEERFGLPAEEMNVRAQPGDTLRGPLGYFPESALRHLTWYDPDLTILIADGQHYGATEPGDLRLVFWATSSNRLRLTTGVGVGSKLFDVTSAYPTLTVGISEECSGAYDPAGFTVETDTGPIEGTVDWDWVSDVQQALNDRGATLAVDGEYGPRTRAAVKAFQTSAAVDALAPWDSDGWIGPRTLEALGVVVPPTVAVRSLRAGHPGSC